VLRLHRILATCFALVLVFGASAAAQPPSGAAQGSLTSPTVEQYLGAAWPYELVSAKKAERIAWIADERGARNVYTAAAPAFRPVKVTPFVGDNGIDLTSLRLSNDGSVVVFVRGHTANRNGWIANPTSDPNGAERAIWAARTAGGPAWRLGQGTDPVLSPDGRFVVFASEGQIYRLRVANTPATTPIDKGEKPFITAWGTNTNPIWSPDGAKIAFVSTRSDHSYIAVYDVARRTVSYMAPDVDRDTSPSWSPDSKRIAFIRRPGLPFGMQTQQGSLGIGNPPGPGAAAIGPQGRGRGAAAAAPPTGGRSTVSTARRSRAGTRSRSGWRRWQAARHASSGTTSRTTGPSRTSTPFSGPATR
jgi:hypothetical protein